MGDASAVLMRASWLLVVFAVSCGRRVENQVYPELGTRHETRPADTFSRPARPNDPKVLFHMRARYGDLRQIERYLVSGQLDEAKALAFLLSKPHHDPALAAWTADADRVASAASALANATTLEQACRLEPQVADACATCHRRFGPLPVFEQPSSPPPDNGTEARMARHQWAVDRMWIGMIGPSDRQWRAALEVLAASPAPWYEPNAGQRLQELSKGALVATPGDPLADRAIAYGKILTTCLTCHRRSSIAH